VVTKELISELEKIRDLFDWTALVAQGPMADRRTKPRWHIRAKLKDSPDNILFDPIGAVCFAKTKLIFSDDYWVEAAITIGLSVQDARDVVAASNDMTWRTVETRREPDPYKYALRTWLVEATGVQIPTVVP
jgi:hypothetical protein